MFICSGEPMAQQILIDKLLMACVKQGASDIHITVGQPPVFRLHGRLRRLETKVLESEDTVSLMKSISPERCQRELQEAGTSEFGFAFGERLDSASRFSSSGVTSPWCCDRSPTITSSPKNLA